MTDKWLMDFLFLFAAIIMLRGGNMWFRPAIFIWLVFAQLFFKFHKNGDIRKLKAWSFRLWKNDFCKLYNERARALQSSITIFLRHPVYYSSKFYKKIKLLQIDDAGSYNRTRRHIVCTHKISWALKNCRKSRWTIN